MLMNAILITGAGVVTPIGVSVAEFWRSCLAGRSGIRIDDRMDVEGLPCGWVSGLLSSDDREKVLTRSGSVGRSWSDVLLYDSVKQALDDASVEPLLGSRVGMIWVRVWPGPSGSDPRDYSQHLRGLASRYDRVQIIALVLLMISSRVPLHLKLWISHLSQLMFLECWQRQLTQSGSKLRALGGFEQLLKLQE